MQLPQFTILFWTSLQMHEFAVVMFGFDWEEFGLEFGLEFGFDWEELGEIWEIDDMIVGGYLKVLLISNCVILYESKQTIQYS